MELDLNPAYNFAQPQSNEHLDNGQELYEEVDLPKADEQPVTIVGGGPMPSKSGGKQRGVNVVLSIAIVAAIALAVIAIVVSVLLTSNSNQEIQTLQLEIENLREMLNQTDRSQNDLSQQVQQELDMLRNNLSYIGTFFNPVSSCSDISQDSPSGEYWIQTCSRNSPVQVYCDMNRTCCSTTGGWTRVANLDMTDPSQLCPDGFRLVNRTTAPLRTCGRPVSINGACLSTTFPVYGIEYTQVCGRIRAYQDQSPDAFAPYEFNTTLTIDDVYVDGIVLTHGQSPRQHIWTFAAAIYETLSDRSACPCTRTDIPYTGVVPPFIGQDYFCETGSRDRFQKHFYANDPLWDGQGCGGTSTCCSFNNPPWFCKQLPQPTTDDIELRLCADQGISDEDTPLEIVELYIN